ncbi:MAG: hypothetical protein WCG61_06845 [Chlorobium sp.]
MGKQENTYTAFQIIEAIRVAARDYIRKAPRTEDEWLEQDYALQRDQTTIWYDKDYAPLLRPFAFSRKWGERFRLLQSEKNREAVLSEVRENIEQQNLTQAVGLALLAWSEEFCKSRQLQGKPDYSPSYVEEQLKKLEQWREYALDVDQEGCSFRDYLANRQAARWLVAADQPQQTPAPANSDDMRPEPDKRFKITKDEYEKKMFPKMIELIASGATKRSASKTVAESFKPISIMPNTIEKKYNKYVESRSNAKNILAKWGRADLTHLLDKI